MQFVIDSPEKLVVRLFVAIARVAKHGGHIWGRGSHVGPPIFSKSDNSLGWPDKLLFVVAILSWLGGGSRCRNLPKPVCFPTYCRAYAPLNNKSMERSLNWIFTFYLAPLLSAFRVNSDANNGVAAQLQDEKVGK